MLYLYQDKEKELLQMLNQLKIDALANKILNLLGEDFSGKVGLRTDSLEYLQVGSTLRNSWNMDEDSENPQPWELDGTSCFIVSGDWEYDSMSTIKDNIKNYSQFLLDYANQNDVFAIVVGDLTNNDSCDPGEIVLSNAKVIALIDRSEITND
jgi:hypothetical protein